MKRTQRIFQTLSCCVLGLSEVTLCWRASCLGLKFWSWVHYWVKTQPKGIPKWTQKRVKSMSEVPWEEKHNICRNGKTHRESKERGARKRSKWSCEKNKVEKMHMSKDMMERRGGVVSAHFFLHLTLVWMTHMNSSFCLSAFAQSESQISL